MAEFKLGRIRFVWKNAWGPGNEYYKDDVVSVGGKAYICIIGHISSPDFFTDLDTVPSKWSLIADGQKYAGQWTNNRSYINDDIVSYGARLYICNNSHTSTSQTGNDIYNITVQSEPGVANGVFYIDGVAAPDIQMPRGITFIWNQDDPSNLYEGAGVPVHPMVLSTTQDGTHNGGEIYTKGVSYFLDNVEVADAVAYAEGFADATTRQMRFTVPDDAPDTMYYFCFYHPNMSGDASAEIISLGLQDDSANWDLFAEGLDWKGEWHEDFNYRINDMVKYGGTTYVCTVPHQSAGIGSGRGIEVDLGFWEVFNAGFEYLNEFEPNFRYKKNDIVKYGAGLWISLNGHTSAADFESDIDNWDKFVEGFQFESEWEAYKDYQTGDIVTYGGNQYIAVSDNRETFPTQSAADWSLFSEGLKFVGDWNDDSSQIEYREGEVVRLGGFTYRCVKDHANQQPPNDEFWQRLNSGFEWRGEWIDGGEYYTGDTVRFGDNSYVALSYHIAEDGVNSPDIADSSEFWSVIAVGTEESVLTTQGDLVYYSGSAPVRLPIGQDGQILQVSSEGIPEWAFLDFVNDVYYVAEDGKDEPAPIYGKSIDRPFRSIRYATKQIENGARNPDARELLEKNRRFIQREIISFVDYQIANEISPFAIDFDYDSAKCERDMGLIVDAVAWDVAHGGNVRSREAALAYVNQSGNFYTLGQEAETVAAINYGLTVIESVLDQTDPVENYQTLAGDNSTSIVSQYKDSALTAEEGVYANTVELVQIITNTISAGTDTEIPPRRIRNTLIKVATGKYYETLPIIVPAECCVLGDELRSTRVEARTDANFTLLPVDDFRYHSVALDRVEQIVGDITEGVLVTPSTSNSLSQYNDWPVAETQWVAPEAERLARLIRREADFKIGTKQEAIFKPYYNMTDPADGRGRDLVLRNRHFLEAEAVAFVNENAAGERAYYSRTQLKRDVSYALEAVSYDVTYGGNWQSVQVGEAYHQDDVLTLGSEDKSLVLSMIDRLNEITKSVATGVEVVPLQTGTAQIFGPASGDTNTVNKIDSLFTDIKNIIDNGAGTVAITYPTVSDADATTIVNALESAKAQIEDDAITFINTNFPNLEYDTAKCERDTGLIIDAAKYDLALGSNFATMVAAYAYRRSSGEKVLEQQKTASIANLEFTRQRTRQEVPTGSQYDFGRTGVDNTFEFVSDIILIGTTEGNVDQVEDIEVYNGQHQIKINEAFIDEESQSYVDEYFSATVTGINLSTNTLTIDSTAWLYYNQPIQFSDNTSGLAEENIYYVYDIISDTEFQISETSFGPLLTLETAWAAEFVVEEAYNYTTDLDVKDIQEIIYAMLWDLTWPQQWNRQYTGVAGISDFEIYVPAIYRTKQAARWYANSIIGSKEEDMYYLRNGTGVRLQTVAGLQGDLSPENEFGTRRPTAGAYASLDPGWGPADERVWITARSPYVQNLTTFGFACIGQKIDGELHDGGNDSIVSNDFTQVISDGIGAWITNNGRAELVSVFSYYAHIGYLAERGGRIRGTNGNNSYGTFGSVAEGVDPEETPVTAVVDNRTQFNATVGSVFVADEILSFEFNHAGNEYTEAEFAVFGPGANEEIVADEFRDNAVYRVKIDAPVDPEDDAGGAGYLVVSNTAQQGSLTGIFLAATDGNISSAYPGMKIYLVGGAGRGQYGIIDTYNSGSKEATVVKEDGTAGWEHVVPGKEIIAPNSTTTYQIEPRIEFSAPPQTSSAITVSSAEYAALDYVETVEIYTAVSATGGTGTGAAFDVTRVGSKYYVAINAAGEGYIRLEELTIAGTDLGGASPLNDITITVLSLDSQGTILEFEFEGYGEKGFFFGLPASGQTAYTSVDGSSWSPTTLATSETWSDVASGLLDDGSSVFKPDSVIAVSVDGTANYSTDGAATWNSSLTGLPTTGSKNISFGNVGVDNNRFVVISDNSQDVAFTVDGGVNWTVTSSALPDTGYDVLAYGKGIFVALASGTSRTVNSEDGVTWAVGSNLPTKNWQDLVWGNGRFVALADDGTVSYSLDGKNWNDVANTQESSGRKISYGHGVFAVTTATTAIQYSEDGINWSSATGLSTDYNTIQFGNPDRTGRFIAISDGVTTAGIDFKAGARARGRASVSNEQIFEIRLAEPGSGYDTAPSVTITDPNNTEEVQLLVRTGVGALANPTFVSRGEGFSEATAEIVASESNGSADFLQDGDLIAVKRLSERPVNGSNVEFAGLPGQFFKLVNTLTFLGDNDGSYTAFLQVSPDIPLGDAPQDEEAVELRIRYSQVRLTGHDFLDIGTGNFEETNYPNEPEYQPDQNNETRDRNGGRVFFTSTDQDGNFRVGDLFSIEQATGVAAINADAFNLAGLQELSLGEVTLGGNSASITEFSTDPFFTANSDNVVPTQRAVKSFIESQIGGGGASLNVNSVTAGDIFIGGDQITTVSGAPINIRANVVFEGSVLGIPLAYHYFLR